MKKLLFILICLLSTKVCAEDFNLKCNDVGLHIVRCENQEVICYHAYWNGGIFCQFKKIGG